MANVVECRMQALRDLSVHFLNEGNAYQVVDSVANRREYAQMVRALKSMGRTERWRNACENAALAALAPDSDLRYVICQHGVFLTYAGM
jgi:hypothetical protein